MRDIYLNQEIKGEYSSKDRVNERTLTLIERSLYLHERIYLKEAIQ
jgi:hypothetical protein